MRPARNAAAFALDLLLGVNLVCLLFLRAGFFHGFFPVVAILTVRLSAAVGCPKRRSSSEVEAIALAIWLTIDARRSN